MVVSTFLVTGIGGWVAEKLVAPRLGEWQGEGAGDADELRPLSVEEKRGLAYALLTGLAITVVLLAGTVPATGFLRDPETHELLHSPFMSGIVTLLFLSGVALGLAYGIGARTVRNDEDLVRGMSKAMETLGGYMVQGFFAAQFVA
jgi:aminobenzoyl-glutamate transport protein